MKRSFVWLGVLACAGDARAMQVASPPSELCGFATLVVLGEVTTKATQWSATGSLETVFDVSVETVLAGTPRADVVVVTPGGELHGLRQTVEDAARLEPDTRYLLLLHEEQNGTFVVTGGASGAFAAPSQGGEAWARALVGACHAR
jgi:hypothetical protein